VTDPSGPHPTSPAQIAQLPEPYDRQALRQVLQDLGLALPRSVVVLVGGAGGLADSERLTIARWIDRGLVPFLEHHRVCLVDGGTDSGVMALAGQARRAAGAAQPHVGVVAAGTIRQPSGPAPSVGDPAAFEPNHTHVLIVPGSSWGDEAPWIGRVATALAADGIHAARPTVTVLANGGQIAYDDVRYSLNAGRPVVILAGTGRTADVFARLSRAHPGSGFGPPELRDAPEDAAELARSPLATVVSGPDDLVSVLRRVLRP
jgi:hypothetical protein